MTLAYSETLNMLLCLRELLLFSLMFRLAQVGGLLIL